MGVVHNMPTSNIVPQGHHVSTVTNLGGRRPRNDEVIDQTISSLNTHPNAGPIYTNNMGASKVGSANNVRVSAIGAPLLQHADVHRNSAITENIKVVPGHDPNYNLSANAPNYMAANSTMRKS